MIRTPRKRLRNYQHWCKAYRSVVSSAMPRVAQDRDTWSIGPTSPHPAAPQISVTSVNVV
jgi:hypothetical protein